MLSSVRRQTISSLFSKYTYSVALLYPAALAISSMVTAAVPRSRNSSDAAAAIFARWALRGSFFLRPI